MYAGFYNPTPAAAVGAFLVWGYGALRRGMRWAALRDSLLETVKTSGMIYLILPGAEMLKIFMSRAGVPQATAPRTEEPTSELQSPMSHSYVGYFLTKKISLLRHTHMLV